MSDKNLDIDNIIKQSFAKAQKDLGLLKETNQGVTVKKSAFDEPFDRQKHMPSFQFKATEWGIKGTTDANQIDAIINAVIGKTVGEDKDSLGKFKFTLEEIIKNLGIETSAFAGLKDVPEAEQPKPSNLQQIIGSLQLNSLISSIIAQDPSAAGKIFEGLLSRIAGGHSNNPDDNPIEDFVDAEGNYISLKLIKAVTGVKGSKANLARGIALSPHNAVVYLVCVKDAERDPFKFKAFSFKVTKDNFFYFINGVKSYGDLTPELKLKIKNDIAVVYNHFKIEVPKEQPKKLQEELEDIDQEKYEVGVEHGDIIKKYFDEEGEPYKSMDDQQKAEEFKKRLKAVIDAIDIKEDSGLLKYYDNAVQFYHKVAPKQISSEKNWNAAYEDIKQNMFFKKEDGKPFKAVAWKSLYFMTKKLMDENDKFALSAVFSDDQKIRSEAEDYYFKLRQGVKFGNDTEYNKILSLVTNEYEKNINKKQQLTKFFNPFKAFIEKYKFAEKKAEKEKFRDEAIKVKPKELSAYMKSSVETGQAQEQDKNLADELESFWNKLAANIRPEIVREQEEEEAPKQKQIKKETQFELPLSTVRAFAIQGGDITGYDDTYPELVVARTELFASAKKNGELFEKWAEPIYKGMHYLTQGINRYFIEDDVNGLSSEEPGAFYGVNEIVTNATEVKKTGKKASELTENKKKDSLNNMTKEARIVMEMLKRMED